MGHLPSSGTDYLQFTETYSRHFLGCPSFLHIYLFYFCTWNQSQLGGSPKVTTSYDHHKLQPEAPILTALIIQRNIWTSETIDVFLQKNSQRTGDAGAQWLINEWTSLWLLQRSQGEGLGGEGQSHRINHISNVLKATVNQHYTNILIYIYNIYIYI